MSDDLLYSKIDGEFVPLRKIGHQINAENGCLVSDHVWSAQGRIFVDRRAVSFDELKQVLKTLVG